jgi:hypothetical protein
MPSIAYSREIPLAAQSLHQAVADVLDAFAGRSRTDALLLSAPVHGTTGKLSIPVELTVTKRSPKDSSVGVTLRARSAEAAFPHFQGAFYALPMSPSRAVLSLKGKYTVPLGFFGLAINAAGMKRVAEEGLRDLFERVADETVAVVREASFQRYREGRTLS